MEKGAKKSHMLKCPECGGARFYIEPAWECRASDVSELSNCVGVYYSINIHCTTPGCKFVHDIGLGSD